MLQSTEIGTFTHIPTLYFGLIGYPVAWFVSYRIAKRYGRKSIAIAAAFVGIIASVLACVGFSLVINPKALLYAVVGWGPAFIISPWAAYRGFKSFEPKADAPFSKAIIKKRFYSVTVLFVGLVLCLNAFSIFLHDREYKKVLAERPNTAITVSKSEFDSSDYCHENVEGPADRFVWHGVPLKGISKEKDDPSKFNSKQKYHLKFKEKDTSIDVVKNIAYMYFHRKNLKDGEKCFLHVKSLIEKDLGFLIDRKIKKLNYLLFSSIISINIILLLMYFLIRKRVFVYQKLKQSLTKNRLIEIIWCVFGGALFSLLPYLGDREFYFDEWFVLGSEFYLLGSEGFLAEEGHGRPFIYGFLITAILIWSIKAYRKR